MPARKHPVNTKDALPLRFGKQIRFLRLKCSLSQEELAERCDLDRTYIGGIERGERNPSLKNIALIAAALGVPLSVLFAESSDEKVQR